MTKSSFTVLEDNKTLVVERTFEASKHAVWSAYTEADKLSKWWGPKGWTTEVKELDLRVGGHWFYIMTCRDETQTEWYGKNSSGKGVYDALQPEDSLSYTDYFTDDEGTITPGMPVSKTKIDLSEKNGQTTIISTTEFESPEALKQVLGMGMQEGFDQTWDNLETFLNS